MCAPADTFYGTLTYFLQRAHDSPILYTPPHKNIINSHNNAATLDRNHKNHAHNYIDLLNSSVNAFGSQVSFHPRKISGVRVAILLPKI